MITALERNMLYDMIEWKDKESNYRAKVILLRDKGYTVPEIRMATNYHHDISTKENGYIDSTRKVLKESYPKYIHTNQFE